MGWISSTAPTSTVTGKRSERLLAPVRNERKERFFYIATKAGRRL